VEQANGSYFSRQSSFRVSTDLTLGDREFSNHIFARDAFSHSALPIESQNPTIDET